MVPLAEKGMIHYLGIHWAWTTGQTIMDMTAAKLDAALARIQTFPCTAYTKKTALEHLSSLVYQLKFAKWPFLIFLELDRRVSPCIKRIADLSELTLEAPLRFS